MEFNLESYWDAIKQGNRAEVEASLAQKPELAAARDENGLSAVLTALYYGQPEIAELFIQKGAPLNIFEASAAGQAGQVIEILSADPGLVNAFAPDGFQPLGLAAFFGHKETARVLLERGADPNTPSRNGLKVQPLNSAVAGQNLEVARLLLAHGADANARQGEDFAPLHGAAQNGQVEMIELLLSHGADLNVRAANQKTPLDYAQDGGHVAAIERLKKAQA